MLQNAYFLAKIGADTAENEQHFAEILPIGRRAARSHRAFYPDASRRRLARRLRLARELLAAAPSAQGGHGAHFPEVCIKP